MKPLDEDWRTTFVRESNEIDPQPGFENTPGSPRWDDHRRALDLAIVAGEHTKLADPRRMHRVLMGTMWPEIAGRPRTVDLVVGGRRCPFHQLVPRLLATWNKRVAALLGVLDHRLRGQDTASRLALVWDLHVEFEHIHPFRDGNGRTGRILMVNHALLLGVDPPLVTYDGRHEYYRRFA